MKYFSFCLVLLSFCLCFGGQAFANPVACDAFRLIQTPKSQHVQITFAYNCWDTVEIAALNRGSKAISGDGTPFKGYVANTGSGLTDLKSIQFCDCEVPFGEHQYSISYSGSWRNGTETADYDSTISVDEALAQPNAESPQNPDAGQNTDTDTDGAMPWDIPESVEIQGLDCISKCAQTAKDGTNEDSSIEDSDEEVSNCSVSAQSSPGNMVVILGLFLAFTIWRKCRG